MSLADHEMEPIDDWEDFCNVHGEYYDYKIGCAACADDAADRVHDDRKERDG